MSSPGQDAQKTALSLVHTLNKGVCDKWRKRAREVTGLTSHQRRLSSSFLEGNEVLGWLDLLVVGEACNRGGEALWKHWEHSGLLFLYVSSFKGGLTIPSPLLWAENVPDLNPDLIGFPLLLVFLLFASRPHLLPCSLRKGGACCPCLAGRLAPLFPGQKLPSNPLISLLYEPGRQQNVGYAATLL